MKFKKILSIFLSLVLVLSVFAGLEINAYAATSGTSGGVNWNLDKSTGVFTITKTVTAEVPIIQNINFLAETISLGIMTVNQLKRLMLKRASFKSAHIGFTIVLI